MGYGAGRISFPRGEGGGGGGVLNCVCYFGGDNPPPSLVPTVLSSLVALIDLLE